jgi:hypothetical protein
MRRQQRARERGRHQGISVTGVYVLCTYTLNRSGKNNTSSAICIRIDAESIILPCMKQM